MTYPIFFAMGVDMNILEIRSIYNDAMIFCEVYEIKNFSLVAKKLGINQSTVTRRIQALEDRLELQLIRRSTRKIEITDDGVKFYQLFTGQENYLRNAIEEFKFSKNSLNGKIRMAIPYGIANHIVSPNIAKYIRENPQVNIELIYQNREADLIKEAIDLAIVRQIPAQQTLMVKKIYEAYVQLFCTPEYISRYGEPKTLEDLETHLITGYIKDDFSVDALMRVEHSDGRSFFIRGISNLSINSTEAGKTLIKGGHTIVIGLDEIYEGEQKRGEVVKVLPEYRFAHTAFYLVRLSNNNSPLVKHFMQFIEECFKLKGKK